MFTTLTTDAKAPDSACQQFEPGEIAGMRSAAVTLFAMAALRTRLWAFEPQGRVVHILVDAFLGVQLWRLRHSWRAWALLRAGLGMAFALMGLIMAVAEALDAASVLAMMGAMAYTASLWLLLYGMPTLRRVVAGRLVFALALLLNVPEILVRVALGTAATE